MSDKKKIKQRLIKNMILNLITFTILFSIFDLIIYNQISNSLYTSIDNELINAKGQYDMPKETFENKQIIRQNEQQNNQIGNFQPPKDNELERLDRKVNPRLLTIIRDENGNITNEDSIGRFYEDYIQEVSFSKNNIEQIYTIKINDEYQYRGYNFKTTNKDGQVIYIQFLANVDAETQVLATIGTTLLIGSGVIIVIAILASYILSKQTIKPIVESWEKQTEFVQNASHELRTPLTIIQAKQELLLQNPDAKIIDKSEDINISLKETKRLSKLIKELMILARSDSNNFELTKESTNIDNLINEVAGPYIDYASSQNKKIDISLNYKKEIKLDANKISQVLIILLDNAIKYTAENEEIKISTYQKDGKCNIEVTDTGIGISDEGLKHIFDRFYREDKARSRETGGNGLGLSIAKTIVEAHSGTIKMMHNEPKGTKVIIKL